MSRVKRALSFAMLAAGIVLVFGGLTNAVGVSTLGVVSSAAAVAALLYSGAVWFGSPAPTATDSTDPIVVFDRSLRVASGALRGLHVSSCFPAPVRADLEAHCRAALAGNRAHFSVAAGEERLDFDAVPVRSPNGEIVYGLLMREEKITPAGHAGA
jgi:hypothetical protein